jgi:3-oxoadipate enol-lactonase
MSVHHVRTRAGALVYEKQGEGAPLFLLHANGHDRHDFDAIAPTLARSFRTIALDWPAMGDSSAPPAPETGSASLLADILEDVVEELAVGPAVFIGSSVGGFASIRLAARRPAAVRGLVAVDTGGFTPCSSFSRAFCWLKGREWFTRSFAHPFAGYYLKRRNAFVRGILRRVKESHRRPPTVAMDAAIWRSFPQSESDLTEEATRVRCPALVVWGRYDPVLRLGKEGAIAQRVIPRATMAVLDTGHLPFAEDPDCFLDVVSPFLAALPSTLEAS